MKNEMGELDFRHVVRDGGVRDGGEWTARPRVGIRTVAGDDGRLWTR
eukprot:SAG22_NODE_15873_length_338_cov_0.794979_1_plen_47_part_00